MSAPQTATKRTRQRRSIAALAALTTGAAGLMLPLGGVAQAQSTTTGALTHTCNASGTNNQWSSNWTLTRPDAIYVNQTVPVTLGGGATFPTEETRWHWWNGRSGAAGSGTLQPQVTVGGTATQFWSTVANFTTSEGANQASGNKPLASNATVQWAAGATPKSFPVQLSGWKFDAKIGDWTRVYNCTGGATELGPLVVKSKSYLTASLPESVSLYRGDERPVTANVTVDGGVVAGKVRITVGEGTDHVSLQELQNGQGTLNVPSDLAPGEYPVKTEFLPTDSVHYDSSAKTTTLVVKDPEVTTSTITAPPLAFSDDAATPLTVNVTAPANNPAGTPAGMVELDLDGTKTSLPIDAQGTATFQMPAQSPGNHTALVRFTPANANRFAASTSSPLTINVKPPAAQTTTTATLEHAEIQTTAKGLVNISVNASGSMPVGDVTLTVNGQNIVKPLTNGQASIELPILLPGEYPITVAYGSTSPLSFRNSNAAPLTLTVLPPAAQTTTTVSVAKGLITPDETNSATVSVQGGTGIPQGTVNIQVNGVEYKKSLDAEGKATIEIPNQLPAGEYPVRASFEPTDTNRFRSSLSQPTGFTVYVQVPTTTTVTVDRQQIVEGDDINVTAAVNATSGTPGGTVQFVVDGVNRGQATSLPGSGTVSTKLNNLSVGEHTVSAVYTPTAGTHHLASTANAVGVAVAQAPNTAALTQVNPTPIQAGQKAVVQATVTYLRGTPEGTVTFTAGGVSATATVNAQGVATAELAGLTEGEWDVVATFASTDGTLNATAAPALLKVNAAVIVVDPAKATTTSVVLSPASAAFGQKVTATATVSNSAVGQVSFNVGGTVVATPVVNGKATVVLPSRGVGRHTLTATFVPTQAAHFLGSKGTATLNVSQATTKSAVGAVALGRGKALLQVSVTPAFAQKLSGKAVLTLKPSAAVKKKFKAKAKTQKVTLSVAANGRASKQVTLLKGAWTAQVSYTGSGTAKASSATKKVTIK